MQVELFRNGASEWEKIEKYIQKAIKYMLVSYWFSEHKYAKQISFDFWLKAIDSQKMFLHLKTDRWQAVVMENI